MDTRKPRPPSPPPSPALARTLHRLARAGFIRHGYADRERTVILMSNPKRVRDRKRNPWATVSPQGTVLYSPRRPSVTVSTTPDAAPRTVNLRVNPNTRRAIDRVRRGRWALFTFQDERDEVYPLAGYASRREDAIAYLNGELP